MSSFYFICYRCQEHKSMFITMNPATFQMSFGGYEWIKGIDGPLCTECSSALAEIKTPHELAMEADVLADVEQEREKKKTNLRPVN